ncbi:MAG: hypothetical protein QOF51_512 [Chloroflexota bacterium]|nr:hypothetical protein [Chloroflexota bacterium]
MDRFTWGFTIGALVLCVVALGSVLVMRAAPPPDPSTPAGVVTAYVVAVRDRDADRAWELLASGANVGPVPPFASGQSPRDAFRQQLTNMGRTSSSARRIRILNTTETGDTARVDVEITTSSGPAIPLLSGGSYSETLTFNLRRINGEWRITDAPSVFQIG